LQDRQKDKKRELQKGDGCLLVLKTNQKTKRTAKR
jgi:hypothetical protein